MARGKRGSRGSVRGLVWSLELLGKYLRGLWDTTEDTMTHRQPPGPTERLEVLPTVPLTECRQCPEIAEEPEKKWFFGEFRDRDANNGGQDCLRSDAGFAGPGPRRPRSRGSGNVWDAGNKRERQTGNEGDCTSLTVCGRGQSSCRLACTRGNQKQRNSAAQHGQRHGHRDALHGLVPCGADAPRATSREMICTKRRSGCRSKHPERRSPREDPGSLCRKSSESRNKSVESVEVSVHLSVSGPLSWRPGFLVFWFSSENLLLKSRPRFPEIPDEPSFLGSWRDASRSALGASP